MLSDQELLDPEFILQVLFRKLDQENTITADQPSFISYIFGFNLSLQPKCKCPLNERTKELKTIIRLKPFVQVEQSLSQFFNSYSHSVCALCRGERITQVQLKSLPDILVISYGLQALDSSETKRTTPIQATIDLFDYISEDNRNDLNSLYELFAIVNLDGDSVAAGRYEAYLMRTQITGGTVTHQWVKYCFDCSIKKVSSHHAINDKNPHLLFYRPKMHIKVVQPKRNLLAGFIW